MRNTMFRRLPVEQATGQQYGGRHRLRVVYRTRDLVVLGLGVMIGSGIFKISGQEAAGHAGPAVIISFLIAGAVCLLAALAYAELSSIIPVAGSAYSFSYVAFGEVWAWVVGWALILELLLAASVVARVWSLYAAQTLSDLNVPVPEWLAGVIGQPKGFDVFALGILVLLIVMLATGGRMSLRTLWFMVLAKLIVIGLVIATGLKFFAPANLTPFVPPARAAPESSPTVLDAAIGVFGGGSPQTFGIWGIFAAAPAIAFAYIGFDLIATAAEETDDAPRKVPRGMLTSLLIAIVLYVAVAVAMVGMVSYDKLDPATPALVSAFSMVGADSMGKIIDIGAVLALTTVILVVLISLTRVVFSMARDGLLPPGLAGMSKYRVPSRATLVSGAAAVVMSQTIDVLTLEQMVVIGTLFAFLFVSAGVLALRRDRPDLHRPFRVPAASLTGVLAIVATGWLMLNLKVQTWGYFTIWMAVGLVIYFCYGYHRSEMRRLLDQPPPVGPPVDAPPPKGYPRHSDATRSPGPGRSTPPDPFGVAPLPAPHVTGTYRLDPYAPGSQSPQPVPPAPQRPAPQAPHSAPPPQRPEQYTSGPYASGIQPAASPPAGDPYRTGEPPAPPYDEGKWPPGREQPGPPYPGGRHRR